MPIVYNYEGPLAQPAVDSAYRAGQRQAAQQRRSELERLQLAREQMAQERMLQQQRMQMQLASQQYGQYGDLQRMLMQYGMQQQQQEQAYAQRRALAEYDSQLQAERDAKYWETKKDFTEYTLSAEGQAEIQKIDRQSAAIKASTYPDTWKQQALAELEQKRYGVTSNPAMFGDGKFEPGTVVPIGGVPHYVNPKSFQLEKLNEPLDPSKLDAHFRRIPLEGGGTVLTSDLNEDGEWRIVEDKFVQSSPTQQTQLDPNKPTDSVQRWLNSMPPEEQQDARTKRVADILKLMDVTIKETVGVGARAMEVEKPKYLPAEAIAIVSLDYGVYEPESDEYNEAVALRSQASRRIAGQMGLTVPGQAQMAGGAARPEAQTNLDGAAVQTMNETGQDTIEMPRGMSQQQAQMWYDRLPPGTKIYIPGAGLRTKPSAGPGTKLYNPMVQ